MTQPVDYKPNNASSSGPRTVLWGDSMIDVSESFAHPVVSSTSYNNTTGVVTITSTGHGQWTGAYTKYWNSNYTSTRNPRFLPITRVDANTYTVTLTEIPQDVPNGALAPTHFSVLVNYGMNWTHFITMYQQKYGWPLNIIRNSAKNGETSGVALSRIYKDVIELKPDLVIWQLLGLNDLANNTLGNKSFTDISTNNRAMLDALVSNGIKVIALTTTPVVSGEVRGSLGSMRRIQDINRDFVAYAKGKPNVLVVDAWKKVIDPTDTTGYGLAARLRSSDKIHWNYAGSAAVFPEFEAALNTWYPTNPSNPSMLVNTVTDCHQGDKLTVSSMSRAANGTTVTYTASAAHNYIVGDEVTLVGVSEAENGVFIVTELVGTSPTSTGFKYENAGAVGAIAAGSAVMSKSRNCWNNPLLATATGGSIGGTVTGTVAGRLTCTGTATTAAASVIAAATVGTHVGVGNEQIITVSAATVGQNIRFNEVGSTAFRSDILMGRKYQMNCRLRLSASAWGTCPISNVSGTLTLTLSSGEIYSVSLISGSDATETNTFTSDTILYLKSGIIETVQPGSSNVATSGNAAFNLIVTFGGTLTGTFTAGLSQISIMDVTNYSSYHGV